MVASNNAMKRDPLFEMLSFVLDHRNNGQVKVNGSPSEKSLGLERFSLFGCFFFCVLILYLVCLLSTFLGAALPPRGSRTFIFKARFN